MEPFRLESRYWGDVWLKEGRPSTGWLHGLYTRKKAQYHYAVRRAMAQCDRYRAENLLEAALQGDTACLKEMKVIKKGGGGPADLPDTVDGANGQDEIVEKFRAIYSALYNSAGIEDEVEVLVRKMERLISPDSLREAAQVTGRLVKLAVSQLKSQKSDVSSSFTSGALLNGPDILLVRAVAVQAV